MLFAVDFGVALQLCPHLLLVHHVIFAMQDAFV